MNARTVFLALLLAIPLLGAALGSAPRAASGDPKADKALQEAVKRGQALWRKSWRPGAKSCMACHLRGPNRMTARRVKSYPKFDKALGKVVSARQKINHMIQSKSGGALLDLSSDQLTDLEAYISTLR